MKHRTKEVLFYLLMECVGIALYVLAHASATKQRGYVAYGGEIFLVMLPFFVYIIRLTVSDIAKAYKEVREKWKENQY